MNGLYRGAYIVVARHTLGGQIFYDIGMIFQGHGTVTEPWQIKSLQSEEKYKVVARDIAKSSYYLNGTLADAEAIYKNMAGKDPVYVTKPPEARNENFSDYV